VTTTEDALRVFDLSAACPHVRRVSLCGGALALDDTFELDELLVPLGPNRSAACATTERLLDVIAECKVRVQLSETTLLRIR